MSDTEDLAALQESLAALTAGAAAAKSLLAARSAGWARVKAAWQTQETKLFAYINKLDSVQATATAAHESARAELNRKVTALEEKLKPFEEAAAAKLNQPSLLKRLSVFGKKVAVANLSNNAMRWDDVKKAWIIDDGTPTRTGKPSFRTRMFIRISLPPIVQHRLSTMCDSSFDF